MQVAILAGGLATRMEPRTKRIPKALLPVAGEPFAGHQLRWLAASGVDDVVYCIGHLGERIRAWVGDGSRWGLRVRYVDEDDRLRGTAGALRLAYDERALEPVFGVLYGDSYLRFEIAAVWREFEARRRDILMCVLRNERRRYRSNARVSVGSVVRYEEGVHDPDAAEMKHIDHGFSIMDRDAVLTEIPSEKVVDLSDVYGRLAGEGRIAAHEATERFYEIGSPEGLAELEALLVSGKRGAAL